ncbi:site-specific integrase [uncultured Maribacter sp.]|uniref:site-specific integrase n=1 Tax=uncultured Maribacter sp. TaxID=431308 RepID=UPI0030D6D1EC|tara:strand:- start:1628 stop:2908 length:1281 start_codon:yes stop_codon:yes gene_type:complete
MQDLLSVLFYIRKAGTSDLTQATVYLRITVNGKRAEVSTMRKVPIAKWDAKANKVIGYTIETKQTNRQLDIVKNRIYEIYHNLLHEDMEGISANRIRDEYIGANKNRKFILEMFEEHNLKMERLVGKDFSFRTLQRYRTTKKHLVNYIKSGYGVKDYPLKKIDVKYVNGFIYFLKAEQNLSHNSALKYVAYFKKIIRVAYANGWLDKDPFYNFKLRPNTIDKEFLSNDEIVKLIQADFSILRLEQVRDVFIFSCYTGLAYVDVAKLKEDDIVIGMDGRRWIKVNRTKTKTLSSIPILPIAEQIISKYTSLPKHKNILLPVYSNQKTNGYLKEIADLSGITKKLTFHMARHTFATTVTLSNGVPIESVCKMLGHKSLKTTQHYAKILDHKLSEDMAKLRLRIEGKSVAQSLSNGIVNFPQVETKETF